ncbi:MAG: hypothetical protein SPL08_04700 [Pseudomonadota bacterium]|nr:hypothetical protein [Pseudomonadota bacterium]
MMTSQTNKTTAFNQLLRLAKNPSICFWEWEDDYHKGGQCREVDWQYPLLCYQAGKNKSDILNDVLYRLTVADFPTTAKQMEKERHLARLLIQAGADPNLKGAFTSFIDKNRVAVALELAKSPDFCFPNGEENAVLNSLSYNIMVKSMHHPCYSKTEFALAKEAVEHPENKTKISVLKKRLQDELKYHRVWQKDSKDLIFLLFQRGIYPQNNSELFQYLAPVVLEREPDFFEKKKQRVLRRIQCAKTPLQIYNALMIREKEKS